MVIQTVHSRCRPSRRALALICALAGLSAIGMVGSGLISPALSQTPNPVTLSLFDPDLADIGTAASEKLKNATSCYPSATFSVGAVDKDDLMRDALGKARQDALHSAFKRLGLDGARFKTEPGSKSSDEVQVSYPRSKADGDKDGPKLKTNSVPKMGTKVKAGDKIKVTITASERYEDGHKSWPTGVRSIQLLADDGKVDDPDKDKGDYGIKPPPCERRTVEFFYTVPSSPPPIVHLKVLAEDAVGNDSSESAEFPTVDVWTGTMHSETTGEYGSAGACPGEAWDFELRLLVGGDNKVTGKATGHLVSMPKCSGAGFHNNWASYQAKDAAYDVAGRLNRQQFDLVFTPTRIAGASHGLLNYSLGVVRFDVPAPTIGVPLKSPTLAQGETGTRIPVPRSANVAIGRHAVDLKCIDCL